jgi:CheY-like chemotaxis protein
MDLQMPEMNGFDAMVAIRGEFPDAKIVVLTTYKGDVQILRALKAGAQGYLLKTTFHKELVQTIRAVHAGRKALSPEASYEIAEHATDDALTPAEIAVLRLIAAGNANKQIADQLSIVCFRQGCISSWPGSGCYTAAPFVSLPAAAGAAGVRTWGVRRHSLLRRIRSIRFAMRPGPPMILRGLIRDVLGSPIFKQRPNEDQRCLVRISELAVRQQPLFVQTVKCILYGRTAGGKCSPTGDPELA